MSAAKKTLEELVQRPGNNICADCGAQDGILWASYTIGTFICTTCAGIHRHLGVHITKVKSLTLDNWDDDQLQYMASQGNLKAKEKYLQHVPIIYRVPNQYDPHVLKEQWIRAQYERNEFMTNEHEFLRPYRDGTLMKQGKTSDKKYERRRFILSEMEGTLKYFIKDAKIPKATLRLEDLDIMVVPDKMGQSNGMQIMFEKDGDTRSIFVYAETGKEMIDWYTAIRSAKFNRLKIAFPGASEHELVNLLPKDFLKEGWLFKTGPKAGDAWRLRWVSFFKRKIMYSENPLDPFPKGEIFLGQRDHFTVREGLPAGITDKGFPFTLKTPKRHFHFTAETEEEQKEWIEVLKHVLHLPMSPQDSSSMFRSASCI